MIQRDLGDGTYASHDDDTYWPVPAAADPCTCGHPASEHGARVGACQAEVTPVARPGICTCDRFQEAADH